MIGIIYKFTIIYGKVDIRPYYIGQHWEKISVENFLRKKGKSYYTGSGTLWNSYLNKLRGNAGGRIGATLFTEKSCMQKMVFLKKH